MIRLDTETDARITAVIVHKLRQRSCWQIFKCQIQSQTHFQGNIEEGCVKLYQRFKFLPYSIIWIWESNNAPYNMKIFSTKLLMDMQYDWMKKLLDYKLSNNSKEARL